MKYFLPLLVACAYSCNPDNPPDVPQSDTNALRLFELSLTENYVDSSLVITVTQENAGVDSLPRLFPEPFVGTGTYRNRKARQENYFKIREALELAARSFLAREFGIPASRVYIVGAKVPMTIEIRGATPAEFKRLVGSRLVTGVSLNGIVRPVGWLAPDGRAKTNPA